MCGSCHRCCSELGGCGLVLYLVFVMCVLLLLGLPLVLIVFLCSVFLLTLLKCLLFDLMCGLVRVRVRVLGRVFVIGLVCIVVGRGKVVGLGVGFVIGLVRVVGLVLMLRLFLFSVFFLFVFLLCILDCSLSPMLGPRAMKLTEFLARCGP